MSETVNCQEKYVEKCDKPKKPSQEDTRAENGQHQTMRDWMARGGKKPSVTV